MTRQARFLIVPVAAVAILSLAGGGVDAAPDEGEVRAAEYHKHGPTCSTLVQLAPQPAKIGAFIGFPEKDTFGFPVEQTSNACEAAHP